MSQDKFQALAILKNFYIQSPASVFLFLMLYFMLDGLILFHKGNLSWRKMSLEWF